MNYAVIDIGSNTIRFNIYKWENYKLNLLFGKKNVAGLGSYIKDGRMTDRGIKKLCFVLENQMEIIKNVNVYEIYAFASASLRNIENADNVIDYVMESVGIKIEILSQEDEARLGFSGIKQHDSHIDGITVDIGGGSTEIISFSSAKIDEMINLSDGCLSLFNKYVHDLLPTESEFKEIKGFIEEKLEKKCTENSSRVIIGIGGTIRATGNIINEYYQTPDNKKFTFKTLDMFYKDLKTNKKDLINTIIQVTPERIHTIAPGVILFRTICKKFSTDFIIVSNSGLREGFLMEKLNSKNTDNMLDS